MKIMRNLAEITVSLYGYKFIISIIFCTVSIISFTRKKERQKFIDFRQIILWVLCEGDAMINTLKYTK
jgi:prolipoprotein diacylglyceryltransferase